MQPYSAKFKMAVTKKKVKFLYSEEASEKSSIYCVYVLISPILILTNKL